MDGVASLIDVQYSLNDIGSSVGGNWLWDPFLFDTSVILSDSEIAREVFVTEKSITQSEWNAAGRNGLNPAISLITPLVNYNGEELVLYKGVRYSVYRTFASGDFIELYLEKKGGTI